jgi:hypothetical protein
MGCASYQCWAFLMAASISISALVISVLGLSGVLQGGECFYTTLIGTIVGLWMPRPIIKEDHFMQSGGDLAKGADDSNEEGLERITIHTDGAE